MNTAGTRLYLSAINSSIELCQGTEERESETFVLTINRIRVAAAYPLVSQTKKIEGVLL